MEITIFTADEIIRRQIIDLIINAISKDNIKTLSVSSQNPETLYDLELLCSRKVKRLIVADISNEQIYNGDWVEAIKILSRNYRQIFFILVSNKDEKATTIFKNKMRVIYFVNQSEENLEEELYKGIKLISRKNSKKINGIYVNDEMDNYVRILFEDVFFIETIKGTHKCMIVHRNGTHILRAGISTFLAKLDSRFVLCRPSTIANMDNVCKIDLVNNILYFENGASCTFSRSNKKMIKSIFIVGNKKNKNFKERMI